MFDLDGVSKETEFDWFPDENEIMYAQTDDRIENQTYTEYDLYETAYVEPAQAEQRDIIFSESLDGAMNEVFSSVYEELCGYELSMKSEILSDYIKELNKSCEVIQTDIDSCTASELAARVERCIGENGRVIAVVDNDMWEEMLGNHDFVFMDSGLRTILIDGKEDDYIYVCDYANQDFNVSITVGDFAKLHGILLEVLK